MPLAIGTRGRRVVDDMVANQLGDDDPELTRTWPAHCPPAQELSRYQAGAGRMWINLLRTRK